jgi:hypothetical protein
VPVADECPSTRLFLAPQTPKSCSLNADGRHFAHVQDFAVDALLVAILLLIGFALGYGVREIISRRHHREAARRRQDTNGVF